MYRDTETLPPSSAASISVLEGASPDWEDIASRDTAVPLTEQWRQGVIQKTLDDVVCLQSLFAKQRNHKPLGEASKQ